jgi:hypothetical protein
MEETTMNYISSESYERVQNAIDSIRYVANIHNHNYTQWYDLIQSLMDESFEALDENQLEMTYRAWIERISRLRSSALKKGFSLALYKCLSELNELQNDMLFYLDEEDEDYEEQEVVITKRSIEKCAENAKKIYYELLREYSEIRFIKGDIIISMDPMKYDIYNNSNSRDENIRKNAVELYLYFSCPSIGWGSVTDIYFHTEDIADLAKGSADILYGRKNNFKCTDKYRISLKNCIYSFSAEKVSSGIKVDLSINDCLDDEYVNYSDVMSEYKFQRVMLAFSEWERLFPVIE